MKIEKEHIGHIKNRFASLQSREDLLQLLNEAKVYMYGEESKPVKLKSLTYYANPDICKKRYTSFSIKKKSGEERVINAPVKGLRSILRVVNFVLNCVYEPHKAATGFVLDRSIVNNAKAHVGKNYVYNLDLKDFFHSFDRNKIKMGFWLEPFNLKDEREPIAFLLACLCSHPFEVDGEVRTVLPQGSPTSPTITNILCHTLDRRLNGLAKRFNLSYTRYADDITFSSSHNIYKDEVFQQELIRIIQDDQNLLINTRKTRNQNLAFRQEVTGLVVNEKVNVHRRYIKQLRMWLYFWEKYGFKRAEQIFLRDYRSDKGHVKTGKPNMVNVIDGKLVFLKMVKGEQDPTYSRLFYRFQKLEKLTSKKSFKVKTNRTHFSTLSLKEKRKNEETSTSLNPVLSYSKLKEPPAKYGSVTDGTSTIVDLIFEKGLEEAMRQYPTRYNEGLQGWDLKDFLSPSEIADLDKITENMTGNKNDEQNEL